MALAADITEAFRVLVRAALSPEIDYLAHYAATVIACASDGATVDVQAKDPRVAKSVGQGVPVLRGTAGVVPVVEAGAEVMICWLGGDPKQPRAALWGTATLTSLTIAEGTKGAARVDDGVDGGTLYFVPGTGGATLTYVAPGGPPVAGTPVALTGFKIGAGSTIVKVG